MTKFLSNNTGKKSWAPIVSWLSNRLLIRLLNHKYHQMLGANSSKGPQLSSASWRSFHPHTHTVLDPPRKPATISPCGRSSSRETKGGGRPGAREGCKSRLALSLRRWLILWERGSATLPTLDASSTVVGSARWSNSSKVEKEGERETYTRPCFVAASRFSCFANKLQRAPPLCRPFAVFARSP